MAAHDPDRRWEQVARVYWLLPASFVVHDGEELLTMPGWISTHRERIADLIEAAGLDPALAGSLPSTPAAAAGAIGTVFLVFLVVTLAATRARGQGPSHVAYAGLLGAYFLHVFTHVGQAVAFGGYTPGVVTAVCVSLPASLYIYRRLFRAHLLTRRTALLSALAGLALFIPFAGLAHALGHWLSAR